MAKKLMINCGTCDARNTKEETLQAYESITINCGDILVSPESKVLLAQYGVTMNCGDVIEMDKDVKIVDINGNHEISGSTPVDAKTHLMVNGSLTIAADAAEVLKSYVGISVNGNLTCPKSLSSLLGKVAVNGSTTIYPDGAIVLKKNAVIDKLFALRAKNKLYWSAKRMIMVDKNLDAAVLAEKKATFSAGEVILAESKVEDMIALIDEEAQITIVPDGTSVIFDDVELDETVIKKHGTKLYVLGDVEVEEDSVPALGKLDYLNIQGDISFPESIKPQVMEAVTEISGDYNIRKAAFTKGRHIHDKMSFRISKWLLEQEPEGITVSDCMNVILEEDIPNDLILNKLYFRDCMDIRCSPEQEAAVGAVAEDCLNIGQGEDGMGIGSMIKGALGVGKELLETKIINAGDYVL